MGKGKKTATNKQRLNEMKQQLNDFDHTIAMMEWFIAIGFIGMILMVAWKV